MIFYSKKLKTYFQIKNIKKQKMIFSEFSKIILRNSFQNRNQTYPNFPNSITDPVFENIDPNPLSL